MAVGKNGREVGFGVTLPTDTFKSEMVMKLDANACIIFLIPWFSPRLPILQRNILP